MNQPKILNNKSKRDQRQQLRNEGTAAEAALWTCLRKRQLLGKKFRRQQSIGPYIVDFYCPECRLVVELDGASHFDPAAEDYDVIRTNYIMAQGLKILRFENCHLLDDLEFVLERIREELREAGETTPALRATPP